MEINPFGPRILGNKSACKSGRKKRQYPYTRRGSIKWQKQNIFKDNGNYGIMMFAAPDFRLCWVVFSPYAGLMCS